MPVREMYRIAIETGKAIDWRGPRAVAEVLRRAQADAQRPGFDPDRLFNPYGINRMLDALQATAGPLTIYDAHNFLRVERNASAR